jgi:hypothetical protein
MGDIAAFGADHLLRRSLRRLAHLGMAAAGMLAALVLAGCAPDYDWREVRAPGGEYWVQVPSKPAVMTRRIHLQGVEVDMTMQGARVKENAFTVGLVPMPSQPAEAAGLSPEAMLAAMREQMLRNIGAAPSTPVQAAAANIVDLDGRRIGKVPLQSVSASGTGRHAGIQMRARFGHWRGYALQIVAVGPQLDAEQTDLFLDSLRLVQP